MKSDLTQIASFENAFEAEQVRFVLEEHGIAAFVDGAHANTALSHVGTALGGVRLLVRQSDVASASEILKSLAAETDDTSSPWFCGACLEEVDAGFECCWSCGRPRAEVEQPFPAASASAPSASEERWPTSDDGAPIAPVMREVNPYASPKAATYDALRAPDEPDINLEAEAILLRAWRASMIGIFLFPPLLQLYSMYLLLRAAALTTDFSPQGKRRYYWAFAINLISGCIWGLAWGALLQQAMRGGG